MQLKNLKNLEKIKKIDNYENFSKVKKKEYFNFSCYEKKYAERSYQKQGKELIKEIAIDHHTCHAFMQPVHQEYEEIKWVY